MRYTIANFNEIQIKGRGFLEPRQRARPKKLAVTSYQPMLPTSAVPSIRLRRPMDESP
jgi:hypothetical protein